MKRILNPLTGTKQPISYVLRHLASQENCDGEPYDQMIEAADELDQLEKQVQTRESQILDFHAKYRKHFNIKNL